MTATPLPAALAAQAAGCVVVAAAVLPAYPDLATQPLLLAAIQGTVAALAAALMRAPPWWLAIHLGFLPAAVLAARLGLPAWVWLAGFGLLLLVFWRTDRSRVPLYLSNAATRAAVASLLPAAGAKVIDLGCGDGALLRRLARTRPDCRFVGIEHAPLPWFWARAASRRLPNVEIRRGDFWAEPLGGYALVYAFLSPQPMEPLWRKAAAEMAPGAMLVSNSFAVPDIPPARIITLGDGRQTRLYCYLPAG